MLSELIENREVAYEAAFEGELPYNPQPDETDIGLSGLWRVHTNKNGRNGSLLNEHLSSVSLEVYRTLELHDQSAHCVNDDQQKESIFGLIDSHKTLPIVSKITSDIIEKWEKALWRNGYDSVIGANVESESGVGPARLVHLLSKRSLIIETAAAVLTTLPLFATNPFSPTANEQADLAKILCNWGPQFLVEWMDGSMITDRLSEQESSPQDEAEWLTVFTPSIRRYIIIHHISDPLAAIDQIRTNIELLNNDAAIAVRLGWDKDEVSQIFTKGIRKNLAVTYISDPLAGLDQVKANLDLLSDTATIAERLGWSQEEVEETFTFSDYKRLAIHNIGNPMQGLDQVKANLDLLSDTATIAERLGWSQEEVEETFTFSDYKRLAIFYVSDPLKGIDQIKTNIELLSDISIAARLNWSESEVAKIFTRGIKKHIAIHNIGNPMQGLDQVKANLDLLSDTATIAERLGWSQEKLEAILTLNMRRKLAVGYISDPISALRDYLAGSITLSTKYKP